MSGIEVIEASADEVEPIPGAVVYIDPPYKGRQPYGPSFPREAVVRAANRWARAGCVVAISEAEPIEIEGAKHIDLTAARRGQARRSLTVGAAEWLTMIGGE